ncbi:MAG: D-alanyl-D-alanine carboxypeptidase/D-alanyl-D-alanine-endopeptidase, partial [Candidatus Aminicenantales bacterium]
MKRALIGLTLVLALVPFLGQEASIRAGTAGVNAALSEPAPPVLLSTYDLQRRIDGILGAAGLSRVLFSVCVVHGKTGEIVYEKSAHLALIPASNMKIVTSAAALEYMGQDFAFVTRVGLCGDALVVKGSGDPLLGDKETDARNGRGSQPVIREIVLRLKEAGITSVSDIVLDTSIFDSERVHPSWPPDQLHQKYACEVSGLNYNGNCVDISAAQRNGKVVLLLDPPNDFVQMTNALTIWRSRQSWFSVVRTDLPNMLVIQGNCRAQAGPYSVAVENPALFFGQLLRESLLREGIEVSGEVLEDTVPEGCEFSEMIAFSTSIGDCLLRTNKDSLGLAAEAMFKRLAAQSDPESKQGSWEGGRRVLTQYVKGRGVDEREFVIADGSGLSRDNRLSANALIRILLHLAAGPDWEVYRNTLAVGGLDGTIERHFWEKDYRGRVQAKSGYIQAVRALSGVVSTDNGDYIFSFLANRAGSGARAAIDSAVKAVVDWAASPA